MTRQVLVYDRGWGEVCLERAAVGYRAWVRLPGDPPTARGWTKLGTSQDEAIATCLSALVQDLLDLQERARLPLPDRDGTAAPLAPCAAHEALAERVRRLEEGEREAETRFARLFDRIESLKGRIDAAGKRHRRRRR